MAPLFSAGALVTLHAFAALAALALGVFQLLRPKGTRPHHWVGWVWTLLMAGLALSSFGIHDLRLIGPFSPIHLLSVFTLVMLVRAIRQARAGKIRAHARTMRLTFYLALVGAGLFTLLPGRVMHDVVFGTVQTD